MIDELSRRMKEAADPWRHEYSADPVLADPVALVAVKMKSQ